MSKLIEHSGVINHIDGDSIYILITQESACGGCHAKGVCNVVDQAEKIIEVKNSDPTFLIGENVLIVVHSSMGLLAVIFAFIIPFIFILSTLFVISFFIKDEAVQGLIAIVALVPYYGLLSFFKKKFETKFQFKIQKETLP